MVKNKALVGFSLIAVLVIVIFVFILPSNAPFIIQHDSEQAEGLVILGNLDTRNLLTEARQIISPQNNYFNAGTTDIIDKTSIAYYQNQDSNSKGKYWAYAWQFNNAELTFQDIQNIVDLRYDWRTGEFLFVPQDGPIDLPLALITSNFSSINFSSGWIIYQKLEYGFVSGPLSGEGIVMNQIVILDAKETLLWMTTGQGFWIA